MCECQVKDSSIFSLSPSHLPVEPPHVGDARELHRLPRMVELGLVMDCDQVGADRLAQRLGGGGEEDIDVCVSNSI